VGDKFGIANPERETGDEGFRKFFHEMMQGQSLVD
jgi:hypothetical protein